MFVLWWCPVPAVCGVHKCLNSVVEPHQVRGYASRILMVCVFEFNPCPVAPWFSDPWACFWSRYKVVDEEDVPYSLSFSVIVGVNYDITIMLLENI